MPDTTHLSITLPIDMADMVKGKVASGQYATESEVIRDGLSVLRARDLAIDEWLREDVAESLDDYDADPDAVIPVDQVMRQLRISRDAGKDTSRKG